MLTVSYGTADVFIVSGLSFGFLVLTLKLPSTEMKSIYSVLQGPDGLPVAGCWHKVQ